MLRQMERSAIQLLAKRGKSQREIAKELGYSRTTVARALAEPVDKAAAKRCRPSQVDPFRGQIEQWLEEGLSSVRMLELARSDPAQSYRGGRSVFSEAVRRIRFSRDQAKADVPVRFEGLPGEYLQVDWGEVRGFPFTQQAAATRYFLACRLKYSRWVWLRWTTDMRQETLLRGLVDCFGAMGFVPWVLVFDNMKTVTSGRDEANQPLWTPSLLQLAREFDFHPEACALGAGNQKGAVESLVKWVKGNFLAGRSFADDADLAAQAADWADYANQRSSSATHEPPLVRLAEEVVRGGRLPAAAANYGFLETAQASREALVPVRGNRYSVPMVHASAPLLVRLYPHRVCLWRDTLLVAEHRRAPDGAHERIVDPDHFAPSFSRKPRAQVMLYRQALLELGEPARGYLSELCQRRRDQLGPEMLAVYALYHQYGTAALLAVMQTAQAAGAFGAEYLTTLLQPKASDIAAPPSRLDLAGVPSQAEIDRRLASYEVFVEGASRELVAGYPGRGVPACGSGHLAPAEVPA